MKGKFVRLALEVGGAIFLFYQSGIRLEVYYPIPAFWWIWGGLWIITVLVLHVIELHIYIHRLEKRPS